MNSLARNFMKILSGTERGGRAVFLVLSLVITLLVAAAPSLAASGTGKVTVVANDNNACGSDALVWEYYDGVGDFNAGDIQTAGNGGSFTIDTPWSSTQGGYFYAKAICDDGRYVLFSTNGGGSVNVTNGGALWATKYKINYYAPGNPKATRPGYYKYGPYSSTNDRFECDGAYDVTVTLTYTKKFHYTVSYSYDTGAANTTDPSSIWYDLNTNHTLNAPDKPGYLCTGYTGTGDIPATGSTSSVNFNLTQDSTITWIYKEAHNLTIGVSPASITASANPQPHAGSQTIVDGSRNLSVTTPITSGNTRYVLNNWSGTGSVVGTGSDNPHAIDLQADSTIAWNYDTEYKLAIAFAAGVPAGVSSAASPSPSGTSWVLSNMSLTPFTTKEIVDTTTGYQYLCTGWERKATDSGTVTASGNNATVSPFAIAEPTTIVWNYSRVQDLEVKVVGLPDELVSGMSPPRGTTKIAHGASPALSAPAEIYSIDRNYRYVLERWVFSDGISTVSGTTASTSQPISSAANITWSYRKEIRLDVESRGLSSISLAAPRECPGISDPKTCINWSNQATPPADSVASGVGVNYYPENTQIITTARYTVTDGGPQKSCTGVVLFGASGTTEGMTDNRKYLMFSLSQPVKITWLYDNMSLYDVGQPIDNFPADWTGAEPVVNFVIPATGLTKDNATFFGGNFNPADPATKNRLIFLQPVTSVNITWPTATASVTKNYMIKWPDTTQTHVVNVPVNLQPAGGAYSFKGIKYSQNGATVAESTFQATSPGRSVLLFTKGPASEPINNLEVKVVVVNSLDWNNAGLLVSDTTTCTVGAPLGNGSHSDPDGGNGYVYFENSYYDGYGANRVYDRATRSGAIVPVNIAASSELTRKMVVVWFQTGANGIGWPVKPVDYQCTWPATTSQLTIGSGTIVTGADYPGAHLYIQADRSRPGYNPNEEHGILTGGMLFALRDDLNKFGGSAPYVLLKYASGSSWAMKLFQVARPAAGFDYDVIAGTPLLPPLPDALQPAAGSGIKSGNTWYYRDHKGGHWAKAATLDPAVISSHIVMKWYYPMQPDFFYPDYDGNGLPDKVTGDPVPFLSTAASAWPAGRGATDLPADVGYTVSWPAAGTVKVLNFGDTLFRAKNGLPDLAGFLAGKVIFDASAYEGKGPLAKLYAPLRSLTAPLAALPAETLFRNTGIDSGGSTIFPELPHVLKARLSYDSINKRLLFKGVDMGDGWLLSNLMTIAERDYLKGLSTSATWDTTIDKLFATGRNPEGLTFPTSGNLTNPFTGANVPATDWNSAWGVAEGIYLGLDQQRDVAGKRIQTQPAPLAIFGEPMALTAGMARGTGYVVLAENDEASLGNAPVALHVIKVDAPAFAGEIKRIYPENLFDEKLTLRHSSDFGGQPEKFVFEWYFQPATGSIPALPADGPVSSPWVFYKAGTGLSDITLESSSSISDKYFTVRYYYRNAWPAPLSVAPSPAGSTATSNPKDANNWSSWAGAPSGVEAQLAEGWIKRVTESLNLLDTRVKDFSASATNTRVSMISQLGESCGGDIAFNSSPDYLNRVGLISAYETILRRGLMFTVNADPPVNDSASNASLLLAASKLAYFSILLGNEAYGDAADPTIGFGTKSGQYGTLAPSVFAFQNQLPSLLEEELALLRGRDTTSSSTRTCPTYNRLAWNFTSGEGEMAYAQAYNISDQDSNGMINEADARISYPQGHGDAWGHYLTGITYYYQLLRNPNYTWIPQSESVTVGGSPLTVDYLDERRFAQIAAMKAKSGAETVDLTFRQMYVDDPTGQWQGYLDSDRTRAWGVDDWARRAGQGAYFDWVTANAILPAMDQDPTHSGIRKVDRTTVREIDDIAARFGEIQGTLTKADQGLNPLGLAKGVVPFDIDPTQIAQGRTHFEQVFDRAQKAVQNSITVYDYANQFSQMLRRNNDTLDKFRTNVADQERDYLNRLIELFGYPYPDDIGPGKTYPAGYDGPDWLHYMYVERSELTGDVQMPAVQSYNVDFNFEAADLDPAMGITATTMPVTFSVDTEHAWMSKPNGWSSKRRAAGEIQAALSELILAQAAFKRGLKEYEFMVGDMDDAKTNLEVRTGVLAANIKVTDDLNNDLTSLEGNIMDHTIALLALRRAADTVDKVANALSEWETESFGFKAGMLLTGAAASTVLNIAGDTQEAAVLSNEQKKEQVQRDADFELQGNDARYEVQQLVWELQGMVNGLVLKQLELATQQEAVAQATARYSAAVAKAQRLMAERASFRAKTAAEVQEYRYDDLSFRVFRNDALQKYRAQFDLAARYVYLAATAYDYETNLLGTDSSAGGRFLQDIVRQRSLGQIINGMPVAGQPGLADPLARMSQNFEVYKSQLGFNNPQTETNRFSLKSELFRLKSDSTEWPATLNKYIQPDLWAIPEFKRYCRPFAPESAGKQPGIVIPFSTTVTFGKNFFNRPLSGGDSAYDPTNFATKVRSVGVWFSNYNGIGLSNTPRVYLVPVGADVLRSPSGDGFTTREWQVVDEKLPVPFPLGSSSLTNPTWIPANDSLSEQMGDVRRFSSLRAFHDSGSFTAAETSTDSRLIGRSVWNTQWYLIIPGGTLLADANAGLTSFIDTVSDIKLFFQTYAYSGN